MPFPFTVWAIITVGFMISFLDSSNVDAHLAGLPVLRTRYVDLVNQERSIFLPLAVIIVILVFALIASIFVKKNEPVSDRIN